MMILLTGPTGSGKTDTSWELLKLFDEMIFLDCDWFASLKPFSWEKESDVQMLFQALTCMIEFHKNRGSTNFVVTLTFQMAQLYHYFDGSGLPIYAFRLRCSDQEAKRRIWTRDRLESQKIQELKDTQIQQHAFDRLFADDDRIFKMIDTTGLNEIEVAQKIKDLLFHPIIN